MNIKKLLIATLTTLTVGGVFFSININSSQIEPNADATDKRIYVYLDGAWDSGNVMHIHYWGGSTSSDFNNAPSMTRVIDSYTNSLGLFYYDVPSDTTNFLVKDRQNGNGSKDSNQSVDIAMNSIFISSPTTDFKATKISAWLGSDSTKRSATFVDTLTLTDSQVVSLLNKIDTCSSNTSNGYNAYPQIYDLFFSTNTFTGSTTVDDDFGESTTITNKINRLSQNYSRGSAT